NITLPCSNTDEALQSRVTVFWRFGDSRTVYDIIDSRASFDEQDASFIGRVESFPAEWTKGNFSISLSNVQKADGGLYTCFIPDINKQMRVQLILLKTRYEKIKDALEWRNHLSVGPLIRRLQVRSLVMLQPSIAQSPRQHNWPRSLWVDRMGPLSPPSLNAMLVSAGIC
uniref:Ig-like domain-containing protein n=1 Tax=Pygocentrus nattereri TaxID=42514 RepID=A0AAR2IKL1_PYGNA